MTSAPLVSVVVVAQQNARRIADALEGALAQQTSSPVEILVGVSASTDGTREICLAYADAYPDKIRVFLRNPDDAILIGGQPTDRFNALATLAAARGTYVALCPGNTCWTDAHKLQQQVDALQADRSLSMSFHQVQWRRATDDAFEGTFPRLQRHRVPVEQLLSASNFVPACSAVYRRSMLPDPLPVWLWREAPVADLPLHVLAGLRGEFHFLPSVMAAQPAGVGSWAEASRVVRARAMVRVRELLLPYVSGKREALLRRALERKRLGLALARAFDGDLPGARDAAATVNLQVLPEDLRTRALRAETFLALRWPDAARVIDHARGFAKRGTSRAVAHLRGNRPLELS